MQMKSKFQKKSVSWLCARMVSILLALILAIAPSISVCAEEEIPIIIGREDQWRFLKEAYTTRSLPYSQTELKALVRNLRDIRTDLAGENIQLIVFVAPDKEEIYWEYLPESHALTGSDPVDVAVQYIRNEIPDLPVVYPKEELIKAKDEHPRGAQTVYYEADSHWNQPGGFVGAQALIRAVGALKGSWYTYTDHGFVVPQHLPTDITAAFFKGSGLGSFDSTEYQYADRLKCLPQEYVVDESNGDLVRMRFRSTDENCLGDKIYFCGDSFRFAIAQPMAEAFSETTVVNKYYLDLDDVLEQHPNIFVLEVAGRYARQLMSIPGFNVSSLPMNGCYSISSFDNNGTPTGEGASLGSRTESAGEGNSDNSIVKADSSEEEEVHVVTKYRIAKSR